MSLNVLMKCQPREDGSYPETHWPTGLPLLRDGEVAELIEVWWSEEQG